MLYSTLLVVVSLVAAIHTQQAPADARHPEPADAGKPGDLERADVGQAPPDKVPASPDWPPVAKRSWNKMQGVWGKRRAPDEDETAASSEEDDDQEVNKRAWSSLTQQGWGKRSWNQMYGAWGKRGNWNKMQGVWGKRSNDLDEEDDEYEAAKRSNWNKMQGVWGKRSQDDGQLVQQDDDVDAEKRAWNQLHGAWGKRSPVAVPYPDGDDDDDDSWTRGAKRGLSPLAAGYKRNWSNLRGSWGKREMPLAIIAGKGNEWSRKRESGWNNLKGLWG